MKHENGSDAFNRNKKKTWTKSVFLVISSERKIVKHVMSQHVKKGI